MLYILILCFYMNKYQEECMCMHYSTCDVFLNNMARGITVHVHLRQTEVMLFCRLNRSSMAQHFVFLPHSHMDRFIGLWDYQQRFFNSVCTWMLNLQWVCQSCVVCVTCFPLVSTFGLSINCILFLKSNQIKSLLLSQILWLTLNHNIKCICITARVDLGSGWCRAGFLKSFPGDPICCRV